MVAQFQMKCYYVNIGTVVDRGQQQFSNNILNYAQAQMHTQHTVDCEIFCA